MYAQGGSFTGTITTDNITATYGTIGEWTLSGGNLSSSGLTLNGNNGSITASSAENSFSLDSTGKLIATGVDIKGTITVNDGSEIDGWEITEKSIRGYNEDGTKLTAF
jgi:hypothetical protein